jgi:hypothetical protein
VFDRSADQPHQRPFSALYSTPTKKMQASKLLPLQTFQFVNMGDTFWLNEPFLVAAHQGTPLPDKSTELILGKLRPRD